MSAIPGVLLGGAARAFAERLEVDTHEARQEFLALAEHAYQDAVAGLPREGANG